jgi:hypothetical protein
LRTVCGRRCDQVATTGRRCPSPPEDTRGPGSLQRHVERRSTIDAPPAEFRRRGKWWRRVWLSRMSPPPPLASSRCADRPDACSDLTHPCRGLVLGFLLKE